MDQKQVVAQGGESDRDLGFGSRVAERSPLRLLNKDGSFNVRRRGLPFFRSLSIYHALLTMSWWRFHVLILISYIAVNLAFAAGYVLCGQGALGGTSATSRAGRFAEAFFFSVHTLAPLGKRPDQDPEQELQPQMHADEHGCSGSDLRKSVFIRG
jgi:inward rectifier potassium channel